MNRCEPEDVGLLSERLKRIEPSLQAFVDARQAPGFLLAVARKGKLAYQSCQGWSDIDAGKPIQADDIFRIYSMTKPITAVAIMTLYEEGRVVLTDPVSRYIPRFKDLQVWTGEFNEDHRLEPLNREITILDLLLHTAGLSYGLFNDSPVEDLYRDSGLTRSETLTYLHPLEEMVKRVVQLPLANQPGQRWRYSIAMDIIGYLIQLITNRPLDVYLKEHIFDPLGMKDTSFFVPVRNKSRFVSLYSSSENGKIELIDDSQNSPFNDPNSPPMGGSGLVSTLADYLQFAQMVLNQGELEGVRILGRKTVEKMSQNYLYPDLLPINLDNNNLPGIGFGLGFGINIDETHSCFASTEGSFYWGGAASTHFFIDPHEQLIGILMTQVMNNPLDFNQVFRQLISQAIID
jgi:CubicO group peptidase (beta-lactamase class C family)